MEDLNEGTSSPYWLILDPKQNMACDVDYLASMITGPYFSRAEAERILKAKRYNYSHRACVYCLSGYLALQYQSLLRTGNLSKD